MTLALIRGAAIALLVLLLANALSEFFIREHYMSAEAVEERRLSYVEELQSYVTEYGLTSSDTAKISKWVTGKRWVSLTLYKDSELLFEYETDPPEDLQDLVDGVTKETADQIVEKIPTQVAEGAYSLRMKDGILLATVDEHSDYYALMVLRLGGILLACAAFFFILFRTFNSTTDRIMRLADGVNRMGQGNLKLTVGDSKGDEISALALNVNRMRDSIVERMEKEQEAWQANTDLITAMSHDIRTPLTILMGYLDLIKAEKDPEKVKAYVDSCGETALRLKHLSDDLFHSFLVFQKTEESTALQPCDVTILFDQIVTERSVLLAEEGFVVKSEGNVPEGMSVVTDTNMLLRIIDNLSSNIVKYADPSSDVRVWLETTDSYCTLCIENRTKALISRSSESTRIGLKTCAKLAEAMGGAFTWEREKNLFRATLSLKRADSVR